MTQHNIIGSERSGPHVVVRQFAKPRRHPLRTAMIAVEFIVCAGIVAAVWSVLA